MERAWPAGITLSGETRAAHTAIIERTKIRTRDASRALKSVQMQPSAPELNERQARARESQGLNLVQGRKMLQVIVALVSSREHDTEMGSGSSVVLGQQERRPSNR